MSNKYDSYKDSGVEWIGDINIMKTYSLASGKEITWKCKSGIECHIWSETIIARGSRGECPYCTNCIICSKVKHC